jgi:hypothetical protein
MTHLWNMRLGVRQIAFAPEGEAGAGGAGPGDPPPSDPPAGDPPAAPPPSDPPAGGPKWWEGPDLSDEDRSWLTARGLADDNKDAVLLKAIKGHREAERRLGHKPEDLLTRPKDGQSVSEWLAAQRDKLGLPDKEDGYKMDPPEGWPEGATWDADLEAQARKIAFEAGLPPEVHKAYVGLYAEKVRQLDEASATMLAEATDKMRGDLRKDWGDQLDARIARAQQAAGVLAEAAGLDGQALQNAAAVLAEKTGDANVLRLFDALAEKLGDDSAVGIGRHAGSLGMTAAEARAEIERQSVKGGEYFEAMKSSDMERQKAAQARITQLMKIAAQGK